jgi:glutathione S-transferase
MTSIVLFGSRGSPFVEKVARALGLKGLAYEPADLKSPLDLKKWNPATGKMPVLQLDGERIFDSTFILRKLDELEPEPPLFSDEPITAASQRMLEDWCDESLYWHIMGLRWCERNTPATLNQFRPMVPAILWPLMKLRLRRNIGGMAKAQGFGRMPYAELIRETGNRLDDLVTLLGDRAFFFSDRISAADLALYGELRMGASGSTPDFEELVAKRPVLEAHSRRVEEIARA